MTSILFLGFLIGLRHALEADHVAAVASLVTKTNSVNQAIKQGAVWGLGHTITLFLFGSAVILMDSVMPETMARTLEFCVGIMLVVLGIDVLRRIMRDKIHFHHHKHQDGKEHVHAHSHRGETTHSEASHDHEHTKGFPMRALLVGLMHGMAGSAALILLTLQTVTSPLTGMIYMALFGLGSIIGMAMLSVVISIPLRYSENGLTWLYNGLHVTIGIMTVLIGAALSYESGISFIDGGLI